MKEMTAVEYFHEKARMIELDFNCLCNVDCSDCPLSRYNNEARSSCSDFEMFYPERAVAIVQKWAEEHPVKTILQDFLEKYPNALLKSYGIPVICPHYVGYEEMNDCKTRCKVCWNRELRCKYGNDNSNGAEGKA